MLDTVLPDTVSGLLKVAIADARSLPRRTYLPYYGDWHCKTKGRCRVCLAGSVLASTAGLDPDYEVSLDRLAHNLLLKVESLDAMRTGNWSHAFELIYRHPPAQDLLDELHALPTPAHSNFAGWRQFDLHLKSLEALVPKLRAIEDSHHLVASL